MRRVLALLAAVLFAACGATVPDRIARLESTLVAPCCWSETIAVHRSPAALEMRREVAAFVAAGKSDREILDHYKAKYGPRVLIEPEGRARLIANVTPWIVASIGVLIAALSIRRMLHHRRTAPETPAGSPPDLPDTDE
jgi:cytochrome c-type biogenesis protein CcmH